MVSISTNPCLSHKVLFKKRNVKLWSVVISQLNWYLLNKKKMFLSIKGVICFNFLCYSNACDLPSIFLQEPVLGEKEVSLLEQYDDPIGVVKKLDRVREKSSGLIYFDSRMFHLTDVKEIFVLKTIIDHLFPRTPTKSVHKS